MRCANCGAKTDHLEEGLCHECYLKTHPNPITYKPQNINICKTCHRIFLKGMWRKFRGIEEKVKELLEQSMKLEKGISITKIETTIAIPLKGGKKANTALVSLHTKYSSDTYEIPYTILWQECPACQMQKTEYFECVLQVRNLTPQIHNYLLKQMDRKQGMFIAKEVAVGNDKDYYLPSNRIAVVLAKKMITAFGGTMSASERLFGLDRLTSKQLFRTNVLVELPRYTKGEYIYRDHHCFIVRVVKKKMTIEDLTSHSTQVSELFLEFEKLTVLKTRVTTIKPTLCVLDPVTFQSVRAQNTAKLVAGQTVKVVKKDNLVWVV